MDKLSSGILGSSENSKTNEANLHGFCTDTFLNWRKVDLRIYLGKKKILVTVLVEHW